MVDYFHHKILVPFPSHPLFPSQDACAFSSDLKLTLKKPVYIVHLWNLRDQYQIKVNLFFILKSHSFLLIILKIS